MTNQLFPMMMFSAALVLSGCSSAANPTAQLPPPNGCGASLLQNKIGEPVSGSSAEDAKVGGVPVRSKGDVRVIAPGQAVIQNYSEARLNLETDTAENLVKASCG